MAPRPAGPTLIDNKILLEKLVRIAVPIAIQGVVSATLSLVDSVMVGSLGEAELASVGIAIQIFIIHWLFLFGFNGGIATFISQFYGTGDYKHIRKVLGLSLTVSFLIAVVFFVLSFFFTDTILRIYSDDPELIRMATPYVKIGAVTAFFAGVASPIEVTLKSTQQTRIPMLISLVVFFTNIFLNYALIFGHFGAPRMGVAGAALATSIARFLQACIDLGVMRQERFGLKGPLSDYFGWTKELMARVFKNAFPTTVNEVFWAVGFSMYTAAFARMGTTAYASFMAADNIRSIFSFTAFSVGEAALILVGEKLGEGDVEYAKALARKMLRIAVVVGLGFGLLLVISAWPMVNLYSLTPLGTTYAFRNLLVIGGTMWISLTIGTCTTGILRGGGDTRFAAMGELGCMWLLGVPTAFACSLIFHTPIYIAILAVKSSELVTMLIMLWRVKTNKWANVMIRGI